MNKPTLKAAFLIRCSTKLQDYQRQINDLNRLCKKFNYVTDESLIYGEYITGKDDVTIKDRESITRLKYAAKRKKFNVILVSEVSRMSRDVISGGTYVRQLTNINMPIYFRDIDLWTINPVTGIKTINAEDVIINAFMAASKYIRSMKVQVASARRCNLENNNQTTYGKVTFGYKRKGGRDKASKYQWVIDDIDSKIVKDVFEFYIKDNSTFLSTAIHVSTKYNRNITTGVVYNILRYKPYATGIRKIKCVDPEFGDVEYYDISIPTIISIDLYKAATAKRAANKKCGKSVIKKYELSGIIRCPECDRAMTLTQTMSKQYWRCYSRSLNRCTCNCNITISNNIEELIKGLISALFKNGNQIASQDKSAAQSLKIAYTDKIQAINTNINKLEAKKHKAYLIAIETDDIEEYQITSQKIKKQIEQLKNEIVRLKIELKDITSIVNGDVSIRNLIKRIVPRKIQHGKYTIDILFKSGKQYQLLYSNRLEDKKQIYYKTKKAKDYKLLTN